MPVQNRIIKNNKMYVIHSICERIVWLVTFFVTRILGSFEVIGKDNIKKVSRPLMIVSNHVSFWDPMTIGTLFPFFSKYLPITFIAADEFFKNPIIRIFFWLTNTIPANKGKGLDVSLKTPREVLKKGGVFQIFPGGQRHQDGSIQKPKHGAAVLALEMPNLTILPINIKMSTLKWNLIDIILRRKKITFNVGKPFKLQEITNSQDMDEVAVILAEEVSKLS